MSARGLPRAVTNGFAESIDDLRGSGRIAFDLVFTWDALIGITIALASTTACWFGGLGKRGHDASGAISTMLSLVIIFPITTLIAMAFSRRDRALAAFATLVGELQATCGAACGWRRGDPRANRPQRRGYNVDLLTVDTTKTQAGTTAASGSV